MRRHLNASLARHGTMAIAGRILERGTARCPSNRGQRFVLLGLVGGRFVNAVTVQLRRPVSPGSPDRPTDEYGNRTGKRTEPESAVSPRVVSADGWASLTDIGLLMRPDGARTRCKRRSRTCDHGHINVTNTTHVST